MPSRPKHKNKKCKTCQYRAYEHCVNGCDYILITGHARGCKVEDCDKYEKGAKIKVKKEITIAPRQKA